MLNKKFLIDITREILNHSKNECPCSDFTGWCEGASSIIYYILTNYTDISDVLIIRGTFDGYGHTWCTVYGEIVDATVDQFGDTYSIYSSELYADLYKAESEDFAPFVFDDWLEYMEELFANKDRMKLMIEE